jgi:hypothetical protein
MSAVMSPRDLPRDGPGFDRRRAPRPAREDLGPAPGLWGWLCTTDHKEIGRRYLVTAFIFLLLGGSLAC